MSKLTRRSFLEQSLLTAAAALAAANVTTAARGEDTAPAPSNAPSSDQKVRCAVIGLNSRGQAHVGGLAEDPNAEVVAICDVDTTQFAKTQQVLKNHGRPEAKTYQDIRQLLDDKDIDAVTIATPNHWHTLAGVWAMQAGKDAYVEKPVSHNITEGRRLEEARIKYNRVCQCGTQSRSNPVIRNAVKFIHDGNLGKVTLGRGLCYKPRGSIGHYPDSTAPATLNYDIWLGPAPVRPFNKNRFIYNWHWNWAYGNGDIGNQGIHQLDVIRWAFKGKTLPQSALSVGGRFGYTDDGETPNSQVSFFDFGDQQLIFEVRGLKTDKYENMNLGAIVYGTEGMVAMSFNGPSVFIDKSGKTAKTWRGGEVNHFSNFVNAVRTRQQSDLHAPILEGHYSSCLPHLANISYRLGTPDSFDAVAKAMSSIDPLAETFKRFEDHLQANKLALQDLHCQSGPSLAFDAAAENFGSNDKANAFLTRDYRAPFVVPTKV